MKRTTGLTRGQSTGELVNKQMVNKELETLMSNTAAAKKENAAQALLETKRKATLKESTDKKKLALHYPKYKKQGFTHTDLRTNEEFAMQQQQQQQQQMPENLEEDAEITEEEEEVIEDVDETRDFNIDETLPEALIISKKEVEEAFRFLDVRQRKKLTPKDLKIRLKSFYPNMTNKEYKFLISEPEFTMQTLQQILNIDTRNSIYGSNFYRSYDPVKEAFKVFDPKDSGFIDEKHLKEIMEQLGLGPITFEDMKVLIEIADKDGDGKISLEDFRDMTNLPDN